MNVKTNKSATITLDNEAEISELTTILSHAMNKLNDLRAKAQERGDAESVKNLNARIEFTHKLQCYLGSW